MFPQKIATDDAAINRLIGLYKRAGREIAGELESTPALTREGKIQTLARIKQRLDALGVNTGEWLTQTIPAAYQVGASQAVNQLNHIGASTTVATNFTVINQNAVQALIDETASAIGSALTNVNKSAERVFDTALQREIADRLAVTRIEGATLLKASEYVRQAIEDVGITALRDKAGKQWELSTYTEMLVRTKAVEARNTGLAHKMIENGFSLVQVSHHYATDRCGAWEGKILALVPDGKHKTLDDAKNGGLFHPRCRHAINVIADPELAKQTYGWDTSTGTYKRGIMKPTGDRPYNAPQAPAGPQEANPVTPPLPLPTTPQGKPEVAIRKYNRTYTFALKPAEQAFVERVGLTFKPGRKSPTLHGYFTPGDNSITVNNPEIKTATDTLFHELAHAIDYHGAPGRQFATSIDDGIKAAVKADATAVVEHRFINMGRTPEDAVLAAAGKPTATRPAQRPSYLRYVFEPKEVYADGYSQWRADPVGFARYAPMLAQIYERVLL